MLEKIKSVMTSQKTFRLLSEANAEYIVKPFLFGTQIENRIFGNYIFVKDSPENNASLKIRKFNNFKETLAKQVNINIKDEIFDTIANNVQYNKEFNIIIAMVPDKIWGTLNKSINIAEKTTKDINTQRKIIINTFNELSIKSEG
jgi:CTP-dependent riboflavin kinase